VPLAALKSRPGYGRYPLMGAARAAAPFPGRPAPGQSPLPGAVFVFSWRTDPACVTLRIGCPARGRHLWRQSGGDGPWAGHRHFTTSHARTQVPSPPDCIRALSRLV
jgi:hypothetical protein